MTSLRCRSWDGHEHRFPPRSCYLCPPSGLCLSFLDLDDVLWPTTHLHLRNVVQRGHALRSRYRGIRGEVPRCVQRPSVFWSDCFGHLHLCRGTGLVGDHRGDLCHPTQAVDYGSRASLVLHHQHPLYLPCVHSSPDLTSANHSRIVDAEPYRCESWRKVRIRLGRNRPFHAHLCILLPSGNERPVIQRA